jgi:hypothetical protein
MVDRLADPVRPSPVENFIRFALGRDFSFRSLLNLPRLTVKENSLTGPGELVKCPRMKTLARAGVGLCRDYKRL